MMRPRSISDVVVFLQTEHWKNASLISGIKFDSLITIPLMVISLSISENQVYEIEFFPIYGKFKTYLLATTSKYVGHKCPTSD